MFNLDLDAHDSRLTKALAEAKALRDTLESIRSLRPDVAIQAAVSKSCDSLAVLIAELDRGILEDIGEKLVYLCALKDKEAHGEDASPLFDDLAVEREKAPEGLKRDFRILARAWGNSNIPETFLTELATRHALTLSGERAAHLILEQYDALREAMA